MVVYQGQAHVLVPALFQALDLDSTVADPLFGEYGKSWGVVDVSTLPEAPKRPGEPVDCRSGNLCIPLRKLPWLLCYLATGYLGESNPSLRASLEGVDDALWHAWDEAQRSKRTDLRVSDLQPGSTRKDHNIAMVFDHLLHGSGTGTESVRCPRRTTAPELGLTVKEFRTALQALIDRGWIERHPALSRNAPAAYRVTPTGLELLRGGNGSLEILGAQNPDATEHPRSNDESTIDKPPDPRVHRLSQHEIVVRLFAANETRRGPRYNRRLLRSVGRCLHAVLAFAGAPVLLSVRGIAKATGMSFRSARIARDRLVAWEVLVDEAGGYRIRYSPLHDILCNAVLPPPNARSPSARGTA